jgi:hypothetical protein
MIASRYFATFYFISDRTAPSCSSDTTAIVLGVILGISLLLNVALIAVQIHRSRQTGVITCIRLHVKVSFCIDPSLLVFLHIRELELKETDEATGN